MIREDQVVNEESFGGGRDEVMDVGRLGMFTGN